MWQRHVLLEGGFYNSAIITLYVYVVAAYARRTYVHCTSVRTYVHVSKYIIKKHIVSIV